MLFICTIFIVGRGSNKYINAGWWSDCAAFEFVPTVAVFKFALPLKWSCVQENDQPSFFG